jgi:hypothetical protein
MGVRNIIECDRCGREIRSGRRTIDVPGLKANGRQQDPGLYPDRKYDLCADCFKEFGVFIDKPTPPRARSIPKGYKRVARPCPHHVPCAEPWGCSGEEVVLDSDPRASLDELGF